MAVDDKSTTLSSLTTVNGALLGAIAIIALGAAVLSTNRGPATAIAQSSATQSAPQAGATMAEPGALTAAQRQEVERIVREVLLKNPDILVEASKELEKRQASLQAEEHEKVIVDKKKELFSSSIDYAMGPAPAKGVITVVEFFDYNCGWCKRAVDELLKVQKADPSLRIVMKELPIFGENSTFAAKAAMASKAQGKYWDYHVALMRERQVTKDNVFKIAEKVGLNVDKLKADMADPRLDEALKEATQIAQALGIEGTPGFIVDSRVNVGYLPAEGLIDLVGQVRAAGCKAC